MNREIKFRGKDKTTKRWRYGFYYSDFNDTSVAYILSNEDGCVHEVIPETVGQYTGLKDKKNNYIYEGDITKSWYSRDVSGTDIIDVIAEVEHEVINELSAFEIPFLREAEVIGNIHENPELLTQ